MFCFTYLIVSECVIMDTFKFLVEKWKNLCQKGGGGGGKF